MSIIQPCHQGARRCALSSPTVEAKIPPLVKMKSRGPWWWEENMGKSVLFLFINTAILCMYMYIYIHTYIHVYVYIYIYDIYTVYIYTHIYIYIYKNTNFVYCDILWYKILYIYRYTMLISLVYNIVIALVPDNLNIVELFLYIRH